MKQLCTFASLHLCVKKKYILLLLLIITASFISAQESFKVKDKDLNEISGIAASRTCPGLYYVHNDSGGKPEVYIINSKGKTISSILLTDANNRDWEDIAVGPGPEPGENYIYVGEIGDNKAQYQDVCLYRFIEPEIRARGNKRLKPINIPAEQIQNLTISFEDGPKDCETLMIDPANGDVYLVSKREQKVGLYQIKAPLSATTTNIARRIMSFDFALAVAGDISPDRSKIIIKNYSTVYCWDVLPDQSIPEALAQKPVKLHYITEPQGEALCWTSTGNKYLTISERSGKEPLFLYVYPFLP